MSILKGRTDPKAYFKGKHVWLTGASQGIGERLAYEFSKYGAVLSLSARKEDQLKKLCDSLNRSGGQAKFYPLDVTKIEQIEAVYKKIKSEQGPVDIVIANAGVTHTVAPAAELSAKEIQQTIMTNLTGAVITINTCLTDMIERKSGHVVGISSVAGYKGLPKGSIYCATKAGLSRYLESVRCENVHKGIKVTDICPGFISTSLLDQGGHPVPFLMDITTAVNFIIHGIAAQKSHYGFPFPMEHGLMKLAAVLPNFVYDRFINYTVMSKY
jgi:short-subunit dehydrogenase